MVKIKTSELTGAALDRAVSVVQGYDYDIVDGQVVTGMSVLITSGDFAGCHTDEVFSPSTDWAQGGPIIERERVMLTPCQGTWRAEGPGDYELNRCHYGPTPLVAAMRCYVASKLGPTVQVPAELAP